MSVRGFVNAGGALMLSKEQISEKMKVIGGDLMSVQIEMRRAREIIPGTILKYDQSIRKYVPIAATDTVGYGTGQVNPGKVKLSVSFGEQGFEHSNMITVNTLSSEYRAQLAFNHPTEGVTAPAGTIVYVGNGQFRVGTYESLQEGTYIVGFLEKPIAEGDEIWYLNTAGGGDYKRGEVIPVTTESPVTTDVPVTTPIPVTTEMPVTTPIPPIETTTQSPLTTEAPGCPLAIAPANAGDPDAGEETNPYEIATLNNLKWLSENDASWDKHFIQTADIDAENIKYCDDEKGWDPPEIFSGNYDGGGHKISNLVINRTEGGRHIGFFQWLDENAVIQDLHLENIDFTGASVMGSFAAEDFGAAMIMRCSATGKLTSTSWQQVGGIVGQTDGIIDRCFTDLEITFTGACYDRAGGIAGYLDASGRCVDSYAKGTINAGAYSAQIGGAFGVVRNAEVLRNYAAVLVIAPDGSDIGGFLGKVHASSTTEVFERNYWDTEVSEQGTSDGEGAGEIEGRTTAEMTYPYDESENTTYVDWDFIDTWADDEDGTENDGYPYLMGLTTTTGP